MIISSVRGSEGVEKMMVNIISVTSCTIVATKMITIKVLIEIIILSKNYGQPLYDFDTI